MTTPQKISARQISYEERALLAQLAALNVMFDSARAGIPSRSFGSNAETSSYLFKAFLAELKSESGFK